MKFQVLSMVNRGLSTPKMCRLGWILTVAYRTEYSLPISYFRSCFRHYLYSWSAYFVGDPLVEAIFTNTGLQIQMELRKFLCIALNISRRLLPTFLIPLKSYLKLCFSQLGRFFIRGNFRVFRLWTWVDKITIYSAKWKHLKLLLITINTEIINYYILAEICAQNAYTWKCTALNNLFYAKTSDLGVDSSECL